jgi:hypothetical protein
MDSLYLVKKKGAAQAAAPLANMERLAVVRRRSWLAATLS